MYTPIVILIVLAAVLMCFIVMIQESKGGGLASSFSSSNQIMGVRKTTDVLEKTTWTLAAVMVVLSIVSSYFIETPQQRGSVMSNQDDIESVINANAAQGMQAPVEETPVAPVTTPTEAE